MQIVILRIPNLAIISALLFFLELKRFYVQGAKFVACRSFRRPRPLGKFVVLLIRWLLGSIDRPACLHYV